jgi:hypothetical protein
MKTPMMKIVNMIDMDMDHRVINHRIISRTKGNKKGE